jgi:hypothetical protein
MRRRHIYSVILLLVLLSICRPVFLRRASAEMTEPSVTEQIARTTLPRWTISTDDFWEWLQLFSGRFAGHDDQDIQGVSLAGNENAMELAAPIWMPANSSQMFSGQYALNQPAIAFWPDRPGEGALGLAPFPGFFSSFNPESPRTFPSISPIAPSAPISQDPPTIGQLPPRAVPEPAASLLLMVVLIPLHRRA